MTEELEVLERFYKELSKNMEANGQLKEESVLFSFFKMNSNRRFKFLEESSINPGIIKKEILSSLLSKEFIRQTDKINHYVITGKGVFEIEKSIFSLNKIINWIDKEYFNLYKEFDRPLKDQEKVVLFSLIAIRSFSNVAAVNLKKFQGISETVSQILEDSYEKLKELNIISELSKEKLYGGFKNESKVSGLFRRLTNLPKKTKGIYVTSGGSTYYLSLSIENKIDKEKLSYLLKQIFGNKKFSALEIKSIYNFLCDVAAKKSIYIFESKERIFSKPAYDKDIEEALYETL